MNHWHGDYDETLSSFHTRLLDADAAMQKKDVVSRQNPHILHIICTGAQVHQQWLYIFTDRINGYIMHISLAVINYVKYSISIQRI